MADAPERSRVDWHGRRLGRKLRPRQQDLLAGLLPQLRVPLPPAGTTPDLAGLFPQPPSQLWLEIGFGSGEHLVEQARRHPEIGFIGCEVFVNGVAALVGQVDRLELANVRIFDDDARLLLAALPEASIGRAFLLFPDPWPKTRHAKRRFIGPANLATMAHILADCAEFRIATDDVGYVRWTLQHLIGHPDFRWRAASPGDWRNPPQDWVETRYQSKAVRSGRQPVFLCFQRRPRCEKSRKSLRFAGRDLY
jgi:tRNA (guanine-N7-)-methyltransferase